MARGKYSSWAACLQLGDAEPLEAELVWIGGLLRHRQIDESVLVRILHVFRETIEEELPNGAEPLHELLAEASRLFELTDRG